MDIRQLRYFVVVAEERGVNRAARRLQVAQPPLSQQLKRLERQLGVTLFRRSSRGMELTAAGEGLLVEAYQVLNDVDRILPRVQAAEAGQTGYLTVGCVPVGFGGMLSSLFRAFRAMYPQVQLEARDLHTRQQYEALEDGVIDLGIARSATAVPHLRSRLILKEKYILAMPSDHRLCKGEVRFRDLADERFIFYKRQLGPWYFDGLVRLCQEKGGFSPAITLQHENLLTMLGMVSAGLGVALVTELSQQFRVPGVVFRDLRDLDATLSLFVLWDSRHRKPAIHNFHQMLDQWSPDSIWELS